MPERDPSAGTAPPLPQVSSAPEASIHDVIGLVLQRWRVALGVPAIVSLLVAIITLVLPRNYTAQASFVPQAAVGAELGRLAGLAAQLGVAVPTADGGQSPDFYAELLQSDEILRMVVDSPLVLARSNVVDMVLLRDSLGGTRRSPPQRSEYAVERLKKRMSVGTGLKTGVVHLSVRTKDPALSAAILDRLLGLVNRFNLDTRRSQAREQRRFLEARLVEARRDLRASEDAQQVFLQRNREFRLSPQLTFENNRLERAVGERQQVVTTLLQAYEQSRIDEVRDTPVITVIEAPRAPARPDRRLLLGKTLLAGVATFGLILILLLAGARARGADWRDGISGQSLVGLWRVFLADVGSGWRKGTAQ